MADIGIWDAIVPWLKTDTTASPLIGFNALRGESAGLNDLVSGRIYRRRAEQPADRPYIIVTGPTDYDHGNHSTGVLTLKLCRFNIIVVSERTVSQITPMVNRILTLMEQVRTKRIGDWWVNAFLLEDMDETEAEAPDGSEQGSPAYVLNWMAGAGRYAN